MTVTQNNNGEYTGYINTHQSNYFDVQTNFIAHYNRENQTLKLQEKRIVKYDVKNNADICLMNCNLKSYQIDKIVILEGDFISYFNKMICNIGNIYLEKQANKSIDQPNQSSNTVQSNSNQITKKLNSTNQPPPPQENISAKNNIKQNTPIIEDFSFNKTINCSASNVVIEITKTPQTQPGTKISMYHNKELAIANETLGNYPISLYLNMSKVDTTHEIIITTNNKMSNNKINLHIITAKSNYIESFFLSAGNAARVVLKYY